MTLRFLIDECLTPGLVQLAVKAGHVESICVRDRGLAGTKDWNLIERVVIGDFTLVTHNAVDFRDGGPGRPGGEHSKQAIHAGLVCLNSAHPLDLQRQLDLFQVALDELSEMVDLVNQALEVFEEEDGSVTVVVYELPIATLESGPQELPTLENRLRSSFLTVQATRRRKAVERASRFVLPSVGRVLERRRALVLDRNAR